MKKPEFLIIGAQKCGTTWLWEMLKQHPGTDLPERKEIHFFGSAELYRNGKDWYYSHFQGLNPSKLTGEASTTYFFDRVPYWHNPSDKLEFDAGLAPIPDLVTKELPEVKVIIMLRDPVKRALSAFKHLIRVRLLSPTKSLRKAAVQLPKKRILSYGLYARYIRLWLQYVPAERMKVLVFEEDVIRHSEKTLADVYGFLGLDTSFRPTGTSKSVNKSMGWTELVLSYYGRDLAKRFLKKNNVSPLLSRIDPFLGPFLIGDKDIEFLRDYFLPMKGELEELLGRSLDCWDYGRKR